MKSTGPTRRASPLARASFHPHFAWNFIWRASSGKKARHLDVSYNFLLLWIKLINEQYIGTKCLALLLVLAFFVVFIWEIVSPPRQGLG